MSNLVLKSLEKHVEVLNRKLEGEDVNALGKELSSAQAYLNVVSDGRVRKTLEKRIAVLNDKIKNAAPDKSLTKIRDNLKLVLGLMETHPNYAKRTRKARKTKK